MSIYNKLEAFANRIPKDKYMHFVYYGVLPFLAAYRVTLYTAPGYASTAGLAAAVLISWFKDYVVDKSMGKAPDPYDVAAGSLAGFLMWLAIP